MGLLLVGVIAGILIGFAWIAPSTHSQACMFQWQGCFDQMAATGPPPPERAPLDPPTAGPDSLVRSQAARTATAYLSAKHAPAQSQRRVALAKTTVQPTRTPERRPVEAPDPVMEKAKVSVAAKLENPASAEFGDMDRAFRKNTLGRAVDTICGHVRGKNASGGNTGERPFLYLVKEDDAYVVDGKPESAAATAYRNICN
jgi:hypothetical protein